MSDGSTSDQTPPQQPPRPDWHGVGGEDEELDTAGHARMAARSRRLLGSLLRPHRWRVLLTALVVLGDTLATIAGPLAISWAIDRGVPAAAHHNPWPLILSAALYGVTACASAVLRFIFYQVFGRMGQQVLFDLRARVFRHTQRLSVSFHERYTSGKVVSRLTSDMESLQDLLEMSYDGALQGVLSVVGIAIILIVLDWPLGLIALAAFVPLAVITRAAQRSQRRAYRRTRTAIARVIVHYVESMAGIRAVQAFRRQPRNDQILRDEDADYRDANAEAYVGLGRFSGLVKWVGNLTIVAVVVVGALRVMDGVIAVGVLAAFVLYLRQFYQPLDQLAMVFNQYQSATAALEKISGVLEEPLTVAEPAEPADVGDFAGELHFARVRFRYDTDEPPEVVEEDQTQARAGDQLPLFDLHIPAGEVVALVGATGAGKSTLAKLLSRFYDPVAGHVSIDGVDLRHLSGSDLRRGIVMVTQESFLFAGSIADNIRLGRPDASQEEVERAAASVGLTEYVASLPDGFETDVRRRGGRLSAGQRQLVAFARVFLADPAVVVLDEATSSLDVPSERLVQRALETVLADRTALIIAHRLSTVAIADRVLVMDAGHIVEDGTPDELIAGQGRFASLHQAWRDSLV